MSKHKQRQSVKKKEIVTNSFSNIFYLDFLTPAQKMAYTVYQQHDVVFMMGPAGTGKTHLSTAFAVQEMLNGTKERLILTRPIVEAGESLGFLPGTMNEKVDPYMIPLYDCLDKLVGKTGSQSDMIKSRTEVRPLAYMRGVTFENAVCILDEAQNCTYEQLILFLTRMGNGSKLIITGDPDQSDLFRKDRTPLARMVEDISVVQGIGVVQFPEKYIVRHPLVTKILKRIRELREAAEATGR